MLQSLSNQNIITIMATSAMTVRMDSQIKKQFDSLCQQFGMSSNTAINIFINQVVRSRSIPFTVSVEVPNEEVFNRQAQENISREQALAAFRNARKRAERGDTPDLTLDEINEEIRLAREERRERQAKMLK